MRLQDREWSSEERGHWTHGHPVSWSAEIMDGAVLVLSRYLDIWSSRQLPIIIHRPPRHRRAAAQIQAAPSSCKLVPHSSAAAVPDPATNVTRTESVSILAEMLDTVFGLESLLLLSVCLQWCCWPLLAQCSCNCGC